MPLGPIRPDITLQKRVKGWRAYAGLSRHTMHFASVCS